MTKWVSRMRFTSLLARGLDTFFGPSPRPAIRVVGVWNLKELAIVRRSCRPSLFTQVFAQHDYPATTALDNHALTSRYFIEELKPVLACLRRSHSFHMYNVQLRALGVKGVS